MSDKSGTVRGVSNIPGVSDTGVLINMPYMSDMSGLIYYHVHCDVGISEMLGIVRMTCRV
jgi:hypothetical protein